MPVRISPTTLHRFVAIGAFLLSLLLIACGESGDGGGGGPAY